MYIVEKSVVYYRKLSYNAHKISHKEGENVALEHVSIWEPESGYRHISIEEAEVIYPEINRFLTS